MNVGTPKTKFSKNQLNNLTREKREDAYPFQVPAQSHQILWTTIVTIVALGLMLSQLTNSKGTVRIPASTLLAPTSLPNASSTAEPFVSAEVITPTAESPPHSN